MTKIQKVIGREIIDSRGFPTVEAEVHTENPTSDNNFGRASVPSGASTGKYEAHELRDENSKRFLGKGVTRAVENINTIISNHLKGHNTDDQENIDKLLIELDGTDNKEKLGANAILAVSMANYRLVNKMSNMGDNFKLPVPLINILNGGVHADNGLDIQEFMIVPVNADSFKHAVQISCEIFHTLKKILSDNSLSTNLGDEGGYAPQLRNHNEALDYLIKAIEKTNYKPGKDIYIALDAASSEFYKNNKYELTGEGKKLSSNELIEYYGKMILSYPIISIEDPMSEDDFDGWKNITKSLGDKVQLVGDDIFVTNTKILVDGIKKNVANSILIKVNQIGTLTETLNAVEMAKRAGYTAVISHRSGETEDTAIADIAVAVNSGQIKTGSVSRTDRTAKYNQLLRIEEILGDAAIFNGKEVFYNL